MPEMAASLRNRWFRIRRPGQPETNCAWAEKFFDNPSEVFDSYEWRLAEHLTGRMHPPIHSHEDAAVAVWAVCVDPV